MPLKNSITSLAPIGTLSVFISGLDILYTILLADLLTLLQGSVDETLTHKIFSVDKTGVAVFILFIILVRFFVNDYLYLILNKLIYDIYCKKIGDSIDDRFLNFQNSEVFDDPGRAVKNYTTDTNIFIGGYFAPIVQLLIDFFIITGLLVYFSLSLQVNIYMIIILSITILMLGWIVWIYSSRVKRFGLKRNKVDDRKSKLLTELSGNWRSLLDLNATKYFSKKLDFLNKEYSFASVGIARNINLTRLSIETYFAILLAVIILLSANKLDYTTGNTSLAVAVVLRLFPTINRAAQSIMSIYSSKGAIESLNFSKPVTKLKTAYYLKKAPSKLTVKSFSISSGKNELLRGGHLDILKNKTNVIHAPSGTGKSLFMYGLYNELKAKGVKVAYIPQNIKLFSVPILENIFLDLSPSKEDRASASSILKILGFSEKQVNGILSGIIKTDDLSGGESQRIFLMRYLLNNFEYLLLDEITSALDEKSELSIVSELKKINNEGTVLLNSHSQQIQRMNVNIINLTDFLK